MLGGRSVFVSGGGRGIGRAIAIACAKAGAQVTVAARTRSQIEAVAREVGGRAIEMDLLDEASVARAAREAGRVDVLVNDAGAFASGDVAGLATADFDRVIGTNLRGAFLLTRALLPAMIERKDGDVLFVSSTSGKRANAGGSAYAASKFGLDGFAHALLQEVRRHGVRVIVVSPSAVDLPERGTMRSNRLQAPDVAEAVVAALSLPRRALVRDVELWAANP